MKMKYKLEKTCPYCGSHLIVRDGQYGEFLACPRFPNCEYTESLGGVKELKLYKPPSPYCEKCGHTGLLPFVKEGKLIPHTFVYCECYEGEHEFYTALRPEDFDFPMSYSFYRSLCQYHDWPDPGPCEPPEITPVELEPQGKPVFRDEINHIKGEITHIHNEQHLQKAKPKKVSKY